MKPALLVIDIQEAFFHLDAETTQSLERAIPLVNAAIALFRKHQLPICCIQHMEGDQLAPGQTGFELPETLNIRPEDAHFHKVYGNAFNKTGLYEHLHSQGVDTVIITGFCAEYCVLSTCRGAEDLDLTAIILRDSLASGVAAHIPFVQAIQECISFGALCKMLA